MQQVNMEAAVKRISGTAGSQETENAGML